MSDTQATINQIQTHELQYLPTVIAAVKLVEGMEAGVPAPGVTSAQKAEAAILAISQTLAASGIPTVSSIAAMVNMTVSIANALGFFKHKPKAAV